MKTLLNKLSKDIKIHEAATGTLYFSYNGKDCRFSDHEQNYGAPRKHDYKEFWSAPLGGEPYDKYDLLGMIAEYLEIAIPESLQKEMDAHLEEKHALDAVYENTQKETKLVQDKYKQKINELRETLIDQKNIIVRIYNEAEEGSSSISKGDKRRKRRRKLFNEAFLREFGFEADYGDVVEAFKKELQ